GTVGEPAHLVSPLQGSGRNDTEYLLAAPAGGECEGAAAADAGEYRQGRCPRRVFQSDLFLQIISQVFRRDAACVSDSLARVSHCGGCPRRPGEGRGLIWDLNLGPGLRRGDEVVG